MRLYCKDAVGCAQHCRYQACPQCGELCRQLVGEKPCVCRCTVCMQTVHRKCRQRAKLPFSNGAKDPKGKTHTLLHSVCVLYLLLLLYKSESCESQDPLCCCLLFQTTHYCTLGVACTFCDKPGNSVCRMVVPSTNAVQRALARCMTFWAQAHQCMQGESYARRSASVYWPV